jgi:probable F420-dependent oxidoreductase
MRFDVSILPDNLHTVTDLARAVEAYGFDGLWTAETAHNPFLPLGHAALGTSHIHLGTAVAIAFARQPFVTARMAWNLAEVSDSRFILGLGTQIKAHITKRFGAEWSPPVPRLREYLHCLSAIWDGFQTGEARPYQGDIYSFTGLSPDQQPRPLRDPHIPVYIAGVNTGLAQLAGEMADGFHVHPFHTVEYLRNTILPAIEAGERSAKRPAGAVQKSCAIFVVTGNTEEEWRANTIAIKSQIAFYASTPSYSRVLELHGWGDIIPRLNQLLRRGQWDDMWQEITDEMLYKFAVVADMADLPAAVLERYDGILDRVGFYFPFDPADPAMRPLWQRASEVFAEQ